MKGSGGQCPFEKMEFSPSYPPGFQGLGIHRGSGPRGVTTRPFLRGWGPAPARPARPGRCQLWNLANPTTCRKEARACNQVNSPDPPDDTQTSTRKFLSLAFRSFFSLEDCGAVRLLPSVTYLWYLRYERGSTKGFNQAARTTSK